MFDMSCWMIFAPILRDRNLNITIKQPVGKLGNIYAPFFIESDIKKN